MKGRENEFSPLFYYFCQPKYDKIERMKEGEKNGTT